MIANAFIASSHIIMQLWSITPFDALNKMKNLTTILGNERICKNSGLSVSCGLLLDCGDLHFKSVHLNTVCIVKHFKYIQITDRVYTPQSS